MQALRLFVRSVGRSLLSVLPAGSADWAYRRVFGAPPLRFLIRKVLLFLIPERIQLPEGVLFLNRHDPVVSGALALSVYEPYELDVFRSLIRPGMTVVDVGANIGLYTVIAAALTGPSGRVVAFEPEPENLRLLQGSIRENGFEQVDLRQSAASDANGSLPLHLSRFNLGKHTTLPQDSDEFLLTLDVRTERMDAALEALGISRVDVIKIDVEGAEPAVLRGMEKVLTQESLVLLIEFSPQLLRHSGSDPQRFLEDLLSDGFALYLIDSRAKALVPVRDLRSFAASFKGEAYANLLCLKGVTPAHLTE